MASGRPGFRWAAKLRASGAFCLAGAVAGTGLYFGNLAYVRAADEAARQAAVARQAAAQQALAERQAAVELAGLLTQSASDRSAINQAWTNAGNCTALSQDQQTFEQAAANRQSLISQLNRIPGVSSLPAGMLADLTGAWQASEQVDRDYAQWASDESTSGCTTNDPSYAAANGPNVTATSDKAAFTALWNPLAQKYGLPAYDLSQI